MLPLLLIVIFFFCDACQGLPVCVELAAMGHAQMQWLIARVS